MVELIVDRFGDVYRGALQDAPQLGDEILFKAEPVATSQERLPDIAFDEQAVPVTLLCGACDLAAIVGADEVVGLGALRTGVRCLEFTLTFRDGGKLHRLSLGDQGR